MTCTGRRAPRAERRRSDGLDCGGRGGFDRAVVSSLVIRLLGSSEIERDGMVVVPPRGHKAWAVLAYVVLAERPVPRARLARLVFGDAEDPRGALRWTLAQLRRALGVAGSLRGDPLELGCRRGLRWTCCCWFLASRSRRSFAASCWKGSSPAPAPSSKRGCWSSGAVGGRLRGRVEGCGAGSLAAGFRLTVRRWRLGRSS